MKEFMLKSMKESHFTMYKLTPSLQCLRPTDFEKNDISQLPAAGRPDEQFYDVNVFCGD